MRLNSHKNLYPSKNEMHTKCHSIIAQLHTDLSFSFVVWCNDTFFFLKHKFDHEHTRKPVISTYIHVTSFPKKCCWYSCSFFFLCVCIFGCAHRKQNMLMVLERYNGSVDQKEKSNANTMTRLWIVDGTQCTQGIPSFLCHNFYLFAFISAV